MEISDPKAIRALAHPLRLDLMELLTAIGPATAAHCGRVLDVPQANCSFHLRQLAKYGFVEDAGPGQDRRERKWRVPADRPSLRVDSGGGAAVVGRELERLVVERELQAVLDYGARRGQESAAWRGKAGVVSAIALVSPEEAAEIEARWLALLEPYIARSEAAGAQHDAGHRHVRYFMAATPLSSHETSGDDDDAADGN
ncbi:ArsR/SmtB family transcription factor [Actinacidiphila acidipaludis]|uniref:Helix-turn-helix domain-containing protein n=1 Tax=Actinacidiphila acidipaludis TaxID=2873382 RepID=A0ABS7Q8R8_9ACTN|nr:helix-turn-helix domain-containing protein [Streptomyces acidipaludis]MBY8879562.1 helix-turn-helix domain-containing protein [Streptomyces acidipaludis]